MPFTVFRRVAILLIPVVALMSCARIESDEARTSMRVDQEGGTIRASDGAVVEIPPGALTEALEISVTTYDSVANMPPEYHSSLVGVNGVADFGPNGAVFEKPVRITIPSPNLLIPGDEYRLYMWNSTERAWQETDFVATVNPDGTSYSADVTHFTTYTGSVFKGPDGFFAPLDTYGDWVVLDEDYQKLNPNYKEIYAGYLQKLFDQWVSNFPSSTNREVNRLKQIEDCCWQEVGLLFQYNFLYEAWEFPAEKEVPQPLGTDYDWREYVFREFPNPDGVTWSAEVVIYWKSKAPSITIDPERAGLYMTCEKEQEQQLTIFSSCGDEGIPGAFIDIYVESGPGNITPENIRTDGNGKSTVTYHTEEEGIASIAGQISTCQQEPEPFRDEINAGICVQDCKDRAINLVMGFYHSGENVSWNFIETIGAIIRFEFDPETGEVYSKPATVSRDVDIEAIDPECSIVNINAPSYKVELQDAKVSDGMISFGIMPDQIPLTFTWYCPPEDENEAFSYTVPGYGNLEGSIMGQELYNIELPLQCSELKVGDAGNNDFGSEGFGEFDMPMRFDYTVFVDEECEVDICKDY